MAVTVTPAAEKQLDLVRQQTADISASQIDELLVGAIDLHVHSGPSIMPRQVNHIEAMQQAEAAGMRGLLFKDHYYSVTPIVKLIADQYPDSKVHLMSGLVLNNAAGDFNAHAVNYVLNLGANLIWMPTVSAANQLRHSYRTEMLRTSRKLLPPVGLTVLTDAGAVRDDVKAVLDQIAAHDAVLSSGHLHISEIFPLFEASRKAGVKRHIVNHPTFVIDATVEDMADLAKAGVFLEHSVNMFLPGKQYTLEDLKTWVEAVGIEQTLFGSDLGQVHNISPLEGMRFAIAMCLKLGFSHADIRKLVGTNAARLMGMDNQGVAA